MASVITLAFEGWKAQEAASGKPVLLDEFVFANVSNLDPSKPIDRNEKLPPENQIVHRQAVNKAGLVSENAVAYSVTLGAEVGDFDFNWIGLLNKESGTVAMITHAPIQKKLKTQNGQQGNVLIRSFLLEFNGAAEETQIKTSAETWQIDFTARLSGIDEMQRLINHDHYGEAAFFDDGFEVTRKDEQYTVSKGLAYISGLRGQLEKNQIHNGLRNTNIYADFSYQGNIVSQWNTVVKTTIATSLDNYVDEAGFTHFVFAIASIDANGNVKDLRPKGSLSHQSMIAFETQFKLDLTKKVDKTNISGVKGNNNDKVPSLNLFTTEVGKLQSKGDYATKTELAQGLNTKLNSSAVKQSLGDSTTEVVSQKTVTEALQNALNINTVYPVGVVIWFAQNKNPNTLFPDTKWQYIGENKTIRLAKANGSNVLTTGGADAIKLTEAQLPAHGHTFSATTSSYDYGNKNTNTTGNHVHNYTKNSGYIGASGSAWVAASNKKDNATTSSSGNHVHTVAIGPHSHTVSGTTGKTGGGNEINITNAFVTLMGWYRIS
ncbi:phage tail-collar fiber domain-containing protein [Arsenophonus apicola]|uniref:phage tail-collar fiber domain-containing protein n=1 Tax=Arsenophonus apicola TaxID=2879119 RepID=UPI001CDC8635|nr:phage tail protein [Arsenophonus apicola]UBX29527.1 phage tail protein [Arsenophonus apicola]